MLVRVCFYAFVSVWDFHSRETFLSITHWLQEVRKGLGNVVHTPLFLVGNKCDLPDHQVEFAEAEALAEREGMALCLETSAKTAHQVQRVFEQLAAATALQVDSSGGGLSASSSTRTVAVQPGKKIAKGCPC